MLSHRLTLTVSLTLCHIPLASSQEMPQTQLSNLLRQLNRRSLLPLLVCHNQLKDHL